MSQSSLPTREERKDGVNSNLGNVICTTEGGSLIQRRRSLTGQIFTSGSPQLTQKEKQQQKQPDFRCAHICLKFKKKKASKRFFVKWIFCPFDCPMKKKNTGFLSLKKNGESLKNTINLNPVRRNDRNNWSALNSFLPSVVVPLCR